jgi:hypothetical protein
MDCVFFIPPRPLYDVGGRRRHSDFDLSLENVWYDRVALLFKMAVRIDSNELRDVEYTNCSPKKSARPMSSLKNNVMAPLFD